MNVSRLTKILRVTANSFWPQGRWRPLYRADHSPQICGIATLAQTSSLEAATPFYRRSGQFKDTQRHTKKTQPLMINHDLCSCNFKIRLGYRRGMYTWAKGAEDCIDEKGANPTQTSFSVVKFRLLVAQHACLCKIVIFQPCWQSGELRHG